MNAYHFTQLNDAYVKKHFSIVGLRLKKDLEGIPTIQDEEIKNKKNIACTRSFDNMMSSLDDLHERISTYTASAAEKLRKQNSHCQLIHVFILSNQFRRDLAQYSGGFTIKLPFSTSSTMELNRHAQKGLEIIYRDGISFKKAGVILMGITKDETQQLSMFEYENPKEKILMKVIDKLNLKLGGKVKFGDQDLKRKWKMNQDYLSPCFTTRVEDIITVKAI